MDHGSSPPVPEPSPTRTVRLRTVRLRPPASPALLSAVLLAATLLTACGSGKDGDLWGTGPIVFADGRDTSRGSQIKRLVQAWNDGNPDERVEMVELAEATDDLRAQQVKRAQDAAARDGDGAAATLPGATGPVCLDLVTVDVIWMAEFARWGYIVPLDEDDVDDEAFLSGAIGSARHMGRLWGLPLRSDVGLLYYRKDVLGSAGAAVPRTWEQLRDQARTVAPAHGLQGYLTQLGRYEGFTLNTLEAIWDTGGTVLGPDGEVLAGPATIGKGLDRLRQGVQEGWIPPETLGFNEERARAAFQDGRALFMRNWTYAYGLLNADDSPVKGKVGVAPLPTPSSLGGWDVAVSKCSRRRATALKFMRYLTSESSERALFTGAGIAPARKALYDDPVLRQGYPHLQVLRASIEGSRNRGTSPYYHRVSSAFQARLHDRLDRPGGHQAALDALVRDLYRATDGR